MSSPIAVDLPHQLGAAEAKHRVAGGIGKLESFLPGGGNVESGWAGDRLNLRIAAMGQECTATIDVGERVVHVEVALPPMLSFFGKQIEALLRREGSSMLEDKSKRG